MNHGDTKFTDSNKPTIVDDGVRIFGGFKSNNTIINKGTIEGEVNASDGYIANNNSILRGPLNAKWVDLQIGRVKGDVFALEQISIDKAAQIKGTIRANSLNQDGLIKGKMVIDDFAVLSKNSKTFGNLTAQFVDIELGSRINGYFNIDGGTVDERLRASVNNVSDKIELAQKVSLMGDVKEVEKQHPARLNISQSDLSAHAGVSGDLPQTKKIAVPSEPMNKPTLGTPIQEVAQKPVPEVMEPTLDAEIDEIPITEVDQNNEVEAIGTFISQSNNLINVAIIILLMLFIFLVGMVIFKYVF